MKTKFLSGIWFIIIILIFISGLCLSGCVSFFKALPENNKNDSLLLIPIEKDDETIITNEWGFKYTIYIKELDKQVYIDPVADFKMFVIRPGKYHITEFRTIRKRDGKIEGKDEFNLPIEMKAGEITFLPFKLVVSWRMGKGGEMYRYQWISIKEVTLGDKRNYIEMLKEYRNYDQWKFSYIK